MVSRGLFSTVAYVIAPLLRRQLSAVQDIVRQGQHGLHLVSLATGLSVGR
jgi:hypothetical protein